MKKKTIEEFIIDARLVHGDKYNYNLVDYKGNNVKVKIVCPIHGVFEQIPGSHLTGRGCKGCANDHQTFTINDFIAKSKLVHGDKYNYDLVEYINSYTKVKIVCHIHGVFEQRPHSHLKGNHGYHTGNGCPKCYPNALSSTDIFISKAKNIHGDRYDYSKVVYIGNSVKVMIICPVHGIFEQTPNHHLCGQGCIECWYLSGISKQEGEVVNFIRSIYQYGIITNSRSVIPPYEIDIYLPKKHLAFEYNGDYWHKEGVMKPFGYHQMKTKKCANKNIQLHHIWEKDWIGNIRKTKDIISSIICG